MLNYSHEELITALNHWGRVSEATKVIDQVYEQLVSESLQAQRVSAAEMLFVEDTVGSAELMIVEGEVSGPTKFRGKFQEANAQNKNKREYPFEILDVNRTRLMETIKARGLVGELDHPTDSIIHFEKASHVITDLWWEGNVMMGEAEILPTPHGKILENLIKSGVRVGISSRGVGNGAVRPSDGVLVIGESYKLITFDVVADPSCYSAFQKMVGAASHKRESARPQSVLPEMPADVVNLDHKNEATRINKGSNTNALIAYVGQLIQNHVEKVRKEAF